jgi:hypothetical protein
MSAAATDVAVDGRLWYSASQLLRMMDMVSLGCGAVSHLKTIELDSACSAEGKSRLARTMDPWSQ